MLCHKIINFGNTIMAGGALNAVDDRSETAVKQNDSVFWHYTQTLKGGDYQGDPELVMTLVSNAWDGVMWLKSMGMDRYIEIQQNALDAYYGK